MRSTPLHARPRRAFSLLEVVVVIVAIALVVPATSALLDRSVRLREFSVSTTRATLLAQCVLDHVLADACSTHPGLGPAAFSDASAYLTTPTTGLRDRTATLVATYESAGFAWDLTIGGLVNASGAVDPVPANNSYRVVTITVTFTDPSGIVQSVPLATMVGGQ